MSSSATPVSHSPAPPHEERALPAEAQAVRDRATRLTTPCGAGELVWHRWPAARPGTGLPPVVLFHGGSGSWTHWYRNILALADAGREVYAPDLPGFGDSEAPPGGTDADALPDPLEQGLAQLLGDSAIDLVGFSFGGMTAGFLAAQFPARIRRLVLVGAPGLGVSSAVPLTSWRHLPDEAARDAVHRRNLSALMVYHPEAITETALRLHVANVLRDRMKGRALARTDVLARCLPRLQCPVDAVYGAHDALYPDTQTELAAVLHHAPYFGELVRVADAGHWVQYEQAGAFNTALLRLLAA